MKIEVLGTGCPKCEQLAKNAEDAVKSLAIDAEISKVTDIVEIADRGVMMTPALSVDGEIVMVGKASSPEEIEALLSK